MQVTINYLKEEIRYQEYQRTRKFNEKLEIKIAKLRVMLKLAYEIEFTDI